MEAKVVRRYTWKVCFPVGSCVIESVIIFCCLLFLLIMVGKTVEIYCYKNIKNNDDMDSEIFTLVYGTWQWHACRICWD